MSGRNGGSSEKKSEPKESKPSSKVFPRIVPVMSNPEPSLIITDSNKKPVSDDELLGQMLDTPPETTTVEAAKTIESENNPSISDTEKELAGDLLDENNKEMLPDFLKFLLNVRRSIEESNEFRNIKHYNETLLKTELETNKDKNKILLKYFSELLKDNRIKDINYVTSLIKKFEIAYRYFKSSK